jgi:quercetin dioxygenase-like cupin family protein
MAISKEAKSAEPEASFKTILPEDIDWKPFAALPPAVRLAVLVGQPSEPGPYMIRVKVPGGVKLMPHRHPEDRVYTVISGVFYIGLGDEFNADKLEAYPPGAVIVLPGNTSHFHWAKSGEYVSQVTDVQGPKGSRAIPFGDFHLLPGNTPQRETILEPGDLITHVTLPPPIVGSKQLYLKLRDRASYEFALASAAVVLTIASGRIARARIALGGVGTKPWRSHEAEAELIGKAATETIFRQAAEAALREAKPQSENRFKIELAKRCLTHALRTAVTS